MITVNETYLATTAFAAVTPPKECPEMMGFSKSKRPCSEVKNLFSEKKK
jgi:hypothetical protein